MTTVAPHSNPGIQRRWKWHHETLLHLREILFRLRQGRREALRALHNERAAGGDYATHNEEQHELMVGFSPEETELAEIEAALIRMQNGSYGFPRE